MIRSKLLGLAFPVALIGALTFAAPSAEAAFVLRLTEGASSVTVVDQGAGDSNPAVGAITFIGPVGVFTINVSTGLSKPVLPASSTFAEMDLNSVNTSNAAGTLVIELTDTDFPATTLPGTLSGSVGGTTEGTATFWAYKNDSNEEFDIVNAEAEIHLGPFTGGPDGEDFSGNASDGHGPLGTYSMTIVAEIVHGAGAGVSTSFDFDVNNTAVPVPAGAVLALTALPVFGLGALVRRRRAKEVVA
ncbi:MAG TPA: hypothetical protein VIL46_16975 [Gemmataceae bacterium]